MDISGKTAIVTGAASGIGLGIATALAEAGANVVMADIQKDVVEQAAHGLSGTNKRVMPVRIDVTQEQSIIDALGNSMSELTALVSRRSVTSSRSLISLTRASSCPFGLWGVVLGRVEEKYRQSPQSPPL